MFEDFDEFDRPSRAPISTLVDYLKRSNPDRVKELIAQRLGAGVYNTDTAEVLYWALVHQTVHGSEIEPAMMSVILDALITPTGAGH